MFIQTLSDKILYHDASVAISETLQNATRSLGGNLSFAKLHNIGNPNFPAQYLQFSDLTGSQIHECSFSDCDLKYAQLHNCSLQNTLFMDSDFSHADFESLKFGCRTHETINSAHSNMQQVRFHACTLKGASFAGSLIEDCVFIYGDDLSDINFRDVKVMRSDFNNLVLERPNLENSLFLNSQFNNVHVIGGAENQPSSQLSNCDFRFCIFKNMDLSKIRFSNSTFYNCEFRNCISIPATFRQCIYRTSSPIYSPENAGDYPMDNYRTPWPSLNSDTISA